MMNVFSLLLAAVLFPNLQVFSQINLPFPKKLQPRLDSIATQDVPTRAPGIATAIILNGQVVYQKCAGYADLSDSSLITENTRFNIASNGKQFTALAVLDLADNKKLSLSDDIRKWFPQLFPRIKEKITIHSLLNHTSGIRDCYDLWSLQGYTWWKKSFDNKDVLNLIERQEDLNFLPDSKYLYSNTNYILLALLVEKITGTTFVEHTNKMFKKLHMPSTSFENNAAAIRGPIARAYFNFSSWTTYSWTWNVCGDGNIFSTLSDQIQWEKIIQGKAHCSLKRSVILKSQQFIEGSTFKNYGYGIEFGTYKSLNYTFHEGATGAWKATVIRFPGKNISLLTLTNTGKAIPSMQTRQMADLVLGLQEDAKYLVTTPSKIGEFVSEDALTGTYLTENDFAFTFEKRDGKIFLKRIGRNDVELEREAANIFHQKFDPAFKQEFTSNQKGEMQVTAYYINHSPYTLTKAISNWEGYDYNKLTGKFLNTETNTTLDIGFSNDKTYNVIIGSTDSTKGLLITPYKLLIDFYSVDIEKKGTDADTLYLNAERMKRIKFIRLK